MKPSLFKNEMLATSDPLYAWIFEGLWCMSDREGRLEDRPRRIHLEVNAGRAYEGTELALNWLAENGFILRYEHGGSRYIQVLQFKKHQNPHVREPASTIPAPGEHSASTGPAPDKHQSGPALSPFPLPDSPVRNARKRATSVSTEFPLDFALDDALRAQALKRAADCDVDVSFEQFRAHHQARGSRFKNWRQAWVSWIGNYEQFGYPKKRGETMMFGGKPVEWQ